MIVDENRNSSPNWNRNLLAEPLGGEGNTADGLISLLRFW